MALGVGFSTLAGTSSRDAAVEVRFAPNLCLAAAAASTRTRGTTTPLKLTSNGESSGQGMSAKIALAFRPCLRAPLSKHTSCLQHHQPGGKGFSVRARSRQRETQSHIPRSRRGRGRVAVASAGLPLGLHLTRRARAGLGCLHHRSHVDVDVLHDRDGLPTA